MLRLEAQEKLTLDSTSQFLTKVNEDIQKGKSIVASRLEDHFKKIKGTSSFTDAKSSVEEGKNIALIDSKEIKLFIFNARNDLDNELDRYYKFVLYSEEEKEDIDAYRELYGKDSPE